MSRSFYLAFVLGIGAAAVSAVLAQSVPGAGKTAPATVPVAAEPPADPAPQVIRVEAIVTDRQGKPILNLRPEEFSLLDNGVAQPLVSAALTTVRSVVGPAIEPPVFATPEDEERAAKEEGTRVIGLYLDEYHVSAGESTDRVRHAAARFVDEHVRSGDVLVVLKPLDSLTDIRFSRNRDAARQKIAGFSGRKDDYTPRAPFEEQYMGRSAASVRSARAQIVISGVRALATRVGELDAGLSAIAILTEGFSAEGARSRERRLPDLQGLVRAASRSHTMLYAFDPSTVAPVDPKRPAPAAMPAPDSSSSTSPMDPLLNVARQTGGDALAPGEDVMAGLQRASRELDAYYVLTYRSSSPNDGRFHEVRISSSRRDARVRTRSGHWAPLPSDLRASRSSEPILPMRAIRRSLLIESWVGMMMEPDGRRRVIFTWAPAPVSSRSKPAARPELVTVKVSTPAGKVMFEGDVHAARAGALSPSRATSVVLEASTGRLQFDLTIQRADGTTLDTSSQDFEVSEVKGSAPVIFQPQLFTASSAREFREIAGDSNAAPQPAREFRRTDRLLMRVPTFDPGGGEVKVSAKLINQVGAVLVTLDRSGEPAADKPAQFDLPLARFAPGEYSLEVAANSSAGSSRQLIRFKITG